MSSRLALASLTHTVNCRVRKTDVVAASQVARGRQVGGTAASVSCDVMCHKQRPRGRRQLRLGVPHGLVTGRMKWDIS